jgi:chromatin remodeling complex protein RSC6
MMQIPNIGGHNMMPSHSPSPSQGSQYHQPNMQQQQTPNRNPPPPPAPVENPPQKPDTKQILQSMYEPLDGFDIPKDLYNIAPSLQTFDKLMNYDKMLDKLLLKKRVDIQEQLTKPFAKTKRILRVHIFNNYINQQNPPNSENPPCWSVRIQGKLLNPSNSLLSGRKFAYFFKQVSVIFDKNDYQQYEDVTWKKDANHDMDGFEIKRLGNKESTIKFVLYLASNPAKYRLNDKLANILGITSCSRIQAMTALWEYVKLNRLQDKENRNVINNDIYLREIFNCEKMQMDTISSKLKDLVYPADPIVIHHKIRLTGDWKENESVYDIEVDLDFLNVNHDIMPFFSHKVPADESQSKAAGSAIKQDHVLITLSQKIKKLEKKAVEYIDKLRRHKAKMESYRAYTKSPSLFIENLIHQQNSHLHVMMEDDIEHMDDYKNLNFLTENEDLLEREIRKYIEKKDDS